MIMVCLEVLKSRATRKKEKSFGRRWNIINKRLKLQHVKKPNKKPEDQEQFLQKFLRKSSEKKMFSFMFSPSDRSKLYNAFLTFKCQCRICHLV